MKNDDIIATGTGCYLNDDGALKISIDQAIDSFFETNISPSKIISELNYTIVKGKDEKLD